jgi:hypothetical protein
MGARLGERLNALPAAYFQADGGAGFGPWLQVGTHLALGVAPRRTPRRVWNGCHGMGYVAAGAPPRRGTRRQRRNAGVGVVSTLTGIFKAHVGDPAVRPCGLRDVMRAAAGRALDPFPLITHEISLHGESRRAFALMRERPDGFPKAVATP